MGILFWLLRLLPRKTYICPKCRTEVPKNSRTCQHCSENYPLPLKIPQTLLKDRKKLEDYVHKVVFPKVSPKHREYLTQFFTTLFSDGFESGDFGAWTTTTPQTSGTTATVAASPVHHGNYAMQVSGLGLATEYGYVAKSVSGSDLYAGQQYRFVSALPTATGSNWRFSPRFSSTSGYSYLVAQPVYDFAANKFGIYYFTNPSNFPVTYESGTTPISADTWYWIELHVVVSATVGKVELWVNGALKVSVTGLANNGRAIGSVLCGNYMLAINEAADKTIACDCFTVADAYIGPEPSITLQAVTDSLSLSDTTLRNRTFSVADSVGLADSSLHNITLLLSDSLRVEDLPRALKTLKVTDVFTLAEAAFTPSRVIRVNENVSLAEVAYVGEGGIKKTKLFLVLGELAIQIAGD